MGFPSDFFTYLNKHNHTGIKGGLDRDSYLDIWIVAVDGRVFARSWGKSPRSWFTEFQRTGLGMIKYGEKEILVTGRKVDRDDPIQSAINKAYLERYTKPENVPYAIGITRPEYADVTMEFEFKQQH